MVYDDLIIIRSGTIAKIVSLPPYSTKQLLKELFVRIFFFFLLSNPQVTFKFTLYLSMVMYLLLLDAFEFIKQLKLIGFFLLGSL